jgi:hypothetical protein
MLARVVRGFLLPLQEAILRRSTFPIWDWLRVNDSMTPQDLARLQVDKLNRLLDHARQTIPYWRGRLEGRLSPLRGCEKMR